MLKMEYPRIEIELLSGKTVINDHNIGCNLSNVEEIKKVLQTQSQGYSVLLADGSHQDIKRTEVKRVWVNHNLNF